MTLNSKNKGNAFERKIAQLLSRAFEHHTGVPQGFRRDITSGSFFGASNQSRLLTHGTHNATFGDLLAPKGWRWHLECKHYKQAPTWKVLIDQRCQQWDTWLAQAQQDASNAGQPLALIVKYNGWSEVVFLQGPHAQAIAHYRGYAVVPLAQWLLDPLSNFFDIP